MMDTIELEFSVRAQAVSPDTIPLINIAPLLHGDETGRRAVAKRIGAAARDIGFFYITHHGIPASLIDAVYARAKEFFALPAAQKAEIAIEKSACHRGYFCSGGENLDPEKQPHGDFKEGIKIGRDLPLTHPRVAAGLPLHGPNLWPSGLPGWRETMQAYYSAMEALGRQMMQGFALALDLPADFFDKFLGEPMTTLGPLHYPPQTGRITEAQIGAGAHTDYGCLTMLAQDSVGGLQVRAKDGTWIEAPPVQNSFVVNIGDMMERWTNGVFTSTLHRVVNISGKERFSLPFFFDPDFDAEVVCLPTCLAAGEEPKFPATTAGNHLLEKINASFNYHKAKDAPSA
jgi:isopenicillin N synthase-like dioxygenase